MGWEDIAAAKRAELLKSIPQEWIIPHDIKPPDDQLDVTKFPEESGWFTARELEITSKNAEELLEQLRSGGWTSEEVTRAFCKRASAAHQLTNCLSETLFDSALEDARRRDKYLQENGSLKGPLHGLPISLKDNFNLIGTDSTLGFVSWANKPMDKNSTLVDMLRNAGAVLYVKTTTPTAMMIPETVNNLFGLTTNPLNRSLTAGGSSGGEAALIAFGGSPLGVGSDIGGSLRIPAACCGIFTLRPSFGRFPTLWTRSGLAGQEAVHSVNGPLARTLADLKVYCEAVVEGKPWLEDPRCLPIPWRKVDVKTKLKIGVLWDDGVVIPTPPVRRALKETVEKLKAAGHEVVDWKPDGHMEGLKLMADLFVADGGISVRKVLDPVKEPFRPEMKQYDNASDIGVYQMWQLQGARIELCKQYLDRWNEAELDAIICPTTPYASCKHGDFSYVGYTGIFNILDYSAVSFPVGIMADSEKDAVSFQKATNPYAEEVQKKYDAQAIHGMPVSLQLVARRLEEEKVLSMVGTVLKAF